MAGMSATSCRTRKAGARESAARSLPGPESPRSGRRANCGNAGGLLIVPWPQAVDTASAGCPQGRSGRWSRARGSSQPQATPVSPLSSAWRLVTAGSSGHDRPRRLRRRTADHIVPMAGPSVKHFKSKAWGNRPSTIWHPTLGEGTGCSFGWVSASTTPLAISSRGSDRLSYAGSEPGSSRWPGFQGVIVSRIASAAGGRREFTATVSH